MGTLNVEVIMKNNNSHFGEDENFLVSYSVLLIISLVLGIKYIIPIISLIKENGYSWV